MDLPFRPSTRASGSAESTLQRRGVGDPPVPPAMAASLPPLIDNEAPSPTDMARLIRHIHERYHYILAGVIEDAVALASACEITHGVEAAWPDGLSDLLVEILDELELHQQREYAVVFPMLLSDSPETPKAAAIMAGEHARLRRRLDSLTAMTGSFAAPPAASVRWRVLYVLCCKIDLELREQMRMEENELFSPFLRHPTEAGVCSAATSETP